MNSNYEIVPEGQEISKSGIQQLLDNIRPVWKDKNLIQRVNRLLPIDPSSACQRLFNAAIHDLKEKILNMGVDFASETAKKHKLPPIDKEEDILEYNVSKTIDLVYRIGILKRPEWRRIHRCYEIRRDLEHEDDEYEAVLEDCFYIFKTSIDEVLSKDPIELLKVTDAKDIVESSTNISVSEEFLNDYENTPKERKKEILEFLISIANDNDKPDIVRENSIELLRNINPLTEKTVKIDIASTLEAKLGKSGIDLIIAKIAYASGALGYFKRVRLKDFYGKIKNELSKTSDWIQEKKICAKLEDVGGLENCPEELYLKLLKELVIVYVGERSYGPYSSSRPVFYSNGAAPIIARLTEEEGERAREGLEKLRTDRIIKSKLEDKYLLRRFENLVDLASEFDEE